MKLVLLQDKPGRASAYSLETLAGVSGHGSVEEFLGACALRGELLQETAAQLGEPRDLEFGDYAAATKALRTRLEAQGFDVIDDPVKQQKEAERSAAFDSLLRMGQGEVLAQAGAMESIKRVMTRSAVALSAAAAIAIGGLAAPEAAHAQSTMERVAKDALGGAAGAALFGQFGKGRGKDVFRVLGAAAGVVTAESMQRPQQPQYQPYPNQPIPSYGGGYPASPQYQQYPTGGNVVMSPDKQEKMLIQQRSYMMARDTYARSLYNAQQAEENRVLDPHNSDAERAAAAAGSAAQSAGGRYNQVRGDFVNAYETMARNGYVMNDFAYSYSLAQRTVTARDISPREQVVSSAQAQPARSYSNDF